MNFELKCVVPSESKEKHRNLQKTTENHALGVNAQIVVTPGVDTPGVYGRSGVHGRSVGILPKPKLAATEGRNY